MPDETDASVIIQPGQVISTENANTIALIGGHLEALDSLRRTPDDVIAFLIGASSSIRPDILAAIQGGS